MKTYHVVIQDVFRIPYYVTGLPSMLLKPSRGEGTISARRVELTVGPIEYRWYQGNRLRVVQVREGPGDLYGIWLNVDSIPTLAKQLTATESSE